MLNPAFGISLGDLAGFVGGTLLGDAFYVVRSVSPLESAGPEDVAFAEGKKGVKLIPASKAGAFIVGEAEQVPEGRNIIRVKNPRLSFAKAIETLRPVQRPAPMVHPAAIVHDSAKLGSRVHIGPLAIIEEGAIIGDNAVVEAGAYVGRSVVVGEGARIFPGARILDHCVLGKRVIVHANAVIGSDGFGYAFDSGRFYKIPQTGIVRVCDDVEIGACSTIDRATLGETVIGRGTKIDNLVQIAHNVRVGEDTVIAAQSGVAGSTVVGSKVMMGGQVGVTDHLKIADGAMFGGRTTVTRDVEAPGAYAGMPAMPLSNWLRVSSVLPELPELRKRIDELSKKVADGK